MLARQTPLILLIKQREDEALLGTEVVMQLAERHSGLLGHLPGRQAAVAVGKQSAPRGVEDERARVCGSNCDIRHGLASSRLRFQVARSVGRSALTRL